MLSVLLHMDLSLGTVSSLALPDDAMAGAWLPGLLLLAALVVGAKPQAPSPEAPLARTMPRVAVTMPPPLENQ